MSGAAQAGLAFQTARGHERTRHTMSPAEVAEVQEWTRELRSTTYNAGPCPVAAGAMAVYAHGSAEAERWKTRAHWRRTPLRATAPPFDPNLPVPVVLVSAVPVDPEMSLTSREWSLEHQAKHSILIRDSCLILDASDAAIVGLYVTETVDRAITGVAATGRRLAARCPHVYPQKRRARWYGNHGGNGGGYIGHNWVDGAQRFACPTPAARQFITAFLPRRPDAGAHRLMALTFAGLQGLERRHVPDVQRQRVALAERAHFGGVVPGLPLEDLAATYVGVTLDFACRPHNDSSIPGTTESICWHRNPADPAFGFTILEYNVTFMIEGSCCLYMPGDIWHGTPPDAPGSRCFPHHSLGLVLMSKKSLLSDTDATRRANENMVAHGIYNDLVTS